MDNLIFISGYAKLPAGITAADLYKSIVVGLLIDRDTGEIVEADCSLVTRTARKLVSNLLVGNNIKDVDRLIQLVNVRYYGPAKRAILSAIRVIHEKYMDIITE